MRTKPITTASPTFSIDARSTTTSPDSSTRIPTTFTGAILLLDLDGFKEINDRLGHQTGDMVLHGIAEQLTRSAPDSAVVARLGGDEFAVLIPDVGSEASTMAIVEQLRTELTRPIVVDGFPLSVGVSIGLAFAPTHGRTPEDLLSAADVAMYRAKRYRTGVESYKALGSRPERGRLGLLGELSHAIAADQLRIHYQPLTRFSDGTPERDGGAAALAAPDLGSGAARSTSSRSPSTRI